MSNVDSVIFDTYGNVIKLMKSWGYKCKKHEDLIKYVEKKDEKSFISYLRNNFVNYSIVNIHTDSNNITLWEKLLSVWKHSEDKNKDALLYFSNYSDEINFKVSKEEAVRSIKYLTHLKKTSLIFVHSGCMSAVCQKHLSSLSILTSNRYSVNILYTPFLKIKPEENFWVPVHHLIRYTPEFYEREGLTRGFLPKIHQNDPGISHLGANVGDVIKVERMEEFDGMSTIMFREVIKPSADFNISAKKK